MTRQHERKILFVDMLSPLGHVNVNYFFIKYVFPHFDQYYYMAGQDLFEQMLAQYGFSEKPSILYLPYVRKGSNSRLSVWLMHFEKAKYILDFIQNNNISCVYFLSYDTLILSMFQSKFNDFKVILMNHDNIARFSKNALRRFILKRLKNFVHVVYDYTENPESMSRLQHLLKFQNILQIKLQIDNSRTITNKRLYTPAEVYLYAPSNGNDDKKIIDLLRATEVKAITLKAKVSETTYCRYQKQYEKNLFFGYIEYEKFEIEMNSADFILLLYPDDYTFRTSGMVFDAIAYEKPVITDNRFLFETYLEKKGMGIFVDNVLDVEKTVSQIDESRYVGLVENIQNYKRSYSAEKIGIDFATKINQIMES